MTQKFSLLSGLICTVFASCSAASAQAPKNAAWNKISVLEQKGYQDLVQEKQAPENSTLTSERKKLYKQASLLLDSYITTYGSQFSAEEDLRMLYRRGLYAEYSGNIGRALVYYLALNDNPKISTTNYNNQPLKKQLAQRLATVPSTYSKSTWIYNGKLGIRVVTTIETPKPPSISQQADIATGLCTASDPITARTVGQQRLSRLVPPQGRKYPLSVATRTGMVVFSVGGAVSDTQVLADRLSAMRRDLIATYFPGAMNLDSTPMLYVYANLLPYNNEQSLQGKTGSDQPLPTTMKLDSDGDTSIEDLGAALSTAVHFDPMSHLEGYYQPLDNSIVLRKGLRSVAGQWYLGTAKHEMVHALVQADYPDAPLWLDEGMASLHEVMDGNRPLDNYRLYYLLEAINAGRMPGLNALVDSESREWKTQQPLMAAMARYLCFYLQQSEPNKDHLRTIYEKMRDGRTATIASAEMFSLMTLHQVTGMEQDDFERKFIAFVKNRDTTFVDANWKYLREDMKNYILGLPVRSSTENPIDPSVNTPVRIPPEGPVQRN